MQGMIRNQAPELFYTLLWQYRGYPWRAQRDESQTLYLRFQDQDPQPFRSPRRLAEFVSCTKSVCEIRPANRQGRVRFNSGADCASARRDRPVAKNETKAQPDSERGRTGRRRVEGLERHLQSIEFPQVVAEVGPAKWKDRSV